MLSNGEWLFAHCSTKLHYIIRQAPFAVAHLLDDDVSVDFNQVTTPNDRVAVIATMPLTANETWQPMQSGEMVYFCEGNVIKVADSSSKCDSIKISHDLSWSKPA